MAIEEEESPRLPKTKQVIVMRKDLNMRKGKMIAQGAHASIAFLTSRLKRVKGAYHNFHLSGEEITWIESSFAKICVYVKSEEELEKVAQEAEAKGLVVHRIIDKGDTEFKGIPTFTCIAIGPHEEDKFIGLTDELPLL